MDRVLDFIEGIDLRRELGLGPRKLVHSFKLPRHKGVIYNRKTQKLFDILPHRVIIRHPISMSTGADRFHVFNITGDEYTYEEYCTDGRVYIDPFETFPILICGDILIKE
jgi:hypothetical protein